MDVGSTLCLACLHLPIHRQGRAEKPDPRAPWQPGPKKAYSFTSERCSVVFAGIPSFKGGASAYCATRPPSTTGTLSIVLPMKETLPRAPLLSSRQRAMTSYPRTTPGWPRLQRLHHASPVKGEANPSYFLLAKGGGGIHSFSSCAVHIAVFMFLYLPSLRGLAIMISPQFYSVQEILREVKTLSPLGQCAPLLPPAMINPASVRERDQSRMKPNVPCKQREEKKGGMIPYATFFGCRKRLSNLIRSGTKKTAVAKCQDVDNETDHSESFHASGSFFSSFHFPKMYSNIGPSGVRGSVRFIHPV